MRILVITLIIILFIFVTDWFSYKAINVSFNQIFTRNIYAKAVFLSTTLITSIFFIIAIIKVNSTGDIFAMNHFYTLLGIIALIYLPKLNISIFYGLDSLSFIILKKHFFLNYIGIGFSLIAFFLVAHGMFINKTNFHVRTCLIEQPLG